MSEPLVEVRELRKSYWVAGTELPVLRGIDLRVLRGEMVVISGESGVGKSTLLHLLGVLDKPTGGCILLSGRDVSRMTADESARFRNSFVGFIFQFHYLLPEFNALENVMIPALIARRPRHEARERAAALLEEVGLADRLEHKPAQLSGGEQQRVAIARALITAPTLLLADEPTGNLDERTSETVHALLRRIVDERELTCIIASHKASMARMADRVMRIVGGRLQPESGPARE
jgi:lipoprotein-releasing system ATP-binding protein